MQKIKSILSSKRFLLSVLLISLLLNTVLYWYSTAPLSKRIIIGSTAPYDKEGTLYLAHGVVVFKNPNNQPKSALQIYTYYIDRDTGKAYAEEQLLLNNVLASNGRTELEIVSFDKNTNIITLSGGGWDKIIIDAEKKEVVEATDSTGDVVYLKSTWEIR